MKIHLVEQKTEPWFALRAGIPTASEFDAIITPEGKPRKGQTPLTYLHKKLAERWIGGALPATYSGGALEQGDIRQAEAVPYFSCTRNVGVEAVGFITTDDGRAGCSPDAWIPDWYTGLEVKCPDLHTHIRYLLDGVVPKDYVAQVQGSMYVAGVNAWWFMSYSPKFPPLVLEVERDGEFVGGLEEALMEFGEQMDLAWARLCELNGGPPERRAAPRNITEVEGWPEDIF